jgi:hypothetical protein
LKTTVLIISFLEERLLSCSVKEATGFDCPGCGMQRAFIALFRGDLTGSLALNPGLLAFLLTLLYCLLHLRFGFPKGARNVVFLFVFTVSLMIVNFIVKLSSAL